MSSEYDWNRKWVRVLGYWNVYKKHKISGACGTNGNLYVGARIIKISAVIFIFLFITLYFYLYTLIAVGEL